MNARVFIATDWHGISRAERTVGGRWQVEQMLADYEVTCLAADPLHPGMVYAGTRQHGVLRSDDGGGTWRPAGMQGEVVKALAASPTEPGVVLAGTKGPGLFASADGGASWREFEGFRQQRRWWWFTPAERGAAYVHGIALSPADPAVMLAGIEFGAVLRSADGGRTWQGHRPGALRDCHSLCFHTADARYVYEGGAGRGAAASVSRDAGQTWQQDKAGLDRSYGWATAADPADPEMRYVSASTGPYKAHGDGDPEAHIFRAAGAGAPWQKLGGGLPDSLSGMPYALLTDPAAPGELVAGLSSGELWHTEDCGDSWQRLPVRLPGIHRSLVMLSG